MATEESSSSALHSPVSLGRPSLTRRRQDSLTRVTAEDDFFLSQQQSPLCRRVSHRFDVTAAGTTARLHSSLVGHGTGSSPFQIFDGDDCHEGNSAIPLFGEAIEFARPYTEKVPPEEGVDPEKTPLLGSSGPPRRLEHVEQSEMSPTSSSPPPPKRSPKTRRRSVEGTPGESLHRKVDENVFHRAATQIPAIALIGLFHLMIGIPFGVSYFPVGWRASSGIETDIDSSGINGPFPLPAKEAVGIRMFLFSTAIGQLVFTYRSNFRNAVGLQMVENVPFCQALATIVIRHQGYGVDALSTVLIIFAISSVVVGSIFWILGRYRLGRVIYFFPTVRIATVEASIWPVHRCSFCLTEEIPLISHV